MIPAQTTLVPAREGRAGPALDGLMQAEVRERAAAGQVNAVPAGPGRSLGQILRANLCTRFNAILGTLFGVVLVVGPPQDALFGLVLAANTAIGVAQELRAKRILDRLAVLTAARARVVRDGTATEIGVEEIVRDDLIILRPGDQAAVDAVVVRSDGLEADESLLSGEAEPVAKQPGVGRRGRRDGARGAGAADLGGVRGGGDEAGAQAGADPGAGCD
jgi:cation-transporting ATPase E